MKIEFSLEIEGDLEAVADYIAQDNPRRAVTFVLEIYKEIKAVGRNPCTIACGRSWDRTQGWRALDAT